MKYLMLVHRKIEREGVREGGSSPKYKHCTTRIMSALPLAAALPGCACHALGTEVTHCEQRHTDWQEGMDYSVLPHHPMRPPVSEGIT